METTSLGGEIFDYPVGRNTGRLKTNCKLAAPHVDQFVRENPRPVMVCRGSSGAMIASCLQMFMETQITIIHIKKEGEISHAGWNDNYLNQYSTFIVVDDFMASGSTIAAILDKVLRIDLLVLAQQDESDLDYIKYDNGSGAVPIKKLIKKFINIC